MTLVIEDHSRLQRLKWQWGMICVAAWILFGAYGCIIKKEAALAQPCPETIGTVIGDLFNGKGRTCLNGIENDFNMGMFFTFLTSPLGYLLGGKIAKIRLQEIHRRLAIQAAAEQKIVEEAKRHQEKAEKEAQEATMAELSERNHREQLASRSANDRYEIITRLGAVDDQLLVLDNETTPENIKLIKLNISQSIRDIHAKFKDDELRAIYAADAGVRQRVERTLGEMRKLKLQDSRFYDDLEDMFHAPIAEGGYRAITAE